MGGMSHGCPMCHFWTLHGLGALKDHIVDKHGFDRREFEVTGVGLCTLQFKNHRIQSVAIDPDEKD